MSRQFVRHPLHAVGRIVKTHLHQLYARTGQLSLSLKEIARIGPQPCLVHSNGERASRTGEAGKPCPCFPSRSHIFAHVRVGTRYDESIQSFLLHPMPQYVYPVFCYKRFHNQSVFIKIIHANLLKKHNKNSRTVFKSI